MAFCEFKRLLNINYSFAVNSGFSQVQVRLQSPGFEAEIIEILKE